MFKKHVLSMFATSVLCLTADVNAGQITPFDFMINTTMNQEDVSDCLIAKDHSLSSSSSSSHRKTVVRGKKKLKVFFEGKRGKRGHKGPQGPVGPVGATGPQGPMAATAYLSAVGSDSSVAAGTKFNFNEASPTFESAIPFSSDTATITKKGVYRISYNVILANQTSAISQVKIGVQLGPTLPLVTIPETVSLLNFSPSTTVTPYVLTNTTLKQLNVGDTIQLVNLSGTTLAVNPASGGTQYSLNIELVQELP